LIAGRPEGKSMGLLERVKAHHARHEAARPPAPISTTRATARCTDGTYSFSQHHSGTCSGHGGVASWL
jgi:hypothetical protein